MGSVQLRRGLPRVAGADGWPPAGATVEVAGADAAVAERVESVGAPETPVIERAGVGEHDEAQREEHAESSGSAQPGSAAAVTARATGPTAALRRGLPRVAGGEPWPPAGAATPAQSTLGAATATVTGHDAPTDVDVSAGRLADSAPTSTPVGREATRVPESAGAATATATGAGVTLRRGLPRTPGGDPWPPAGVVGNATATAAAPEASSPAAEASVPATVEASAPAIPALDVSTPLSFPRTVFPGRAPRHPAPTPEPTRHGPFTTAQWVGAVIVGGVGLLFAAGMVVLAVRVFVSLPFMVDFMHTYPGQYSLPASAPVGFPVWLNWQHFLNVFFIVLIVRTGLGVRHQKRPSVFWTPRGQAKRKVSLTLWTHQALDTLWILNGAVFIVLLFVTGQWMRLVPTSWSVFPNAVSAALQYASLDWPHDDGWINYNSLQQLTYFGVVFLLAPLAIATGVRMSTVWPKDAKALNKAYPVEWARAVHFPVMLVFVLFVIVHVTLVFATGALRNLNHMYGASDAVNWVGFWWFAGSLVVIAAGWAALRPLVLAPIARLFGTVSGR